MIEKITPQPEGGFLRSEHWASFLRTEGHDVFDVGEFFAMKNKVPFFGPYLYTPRFAPENNTQIETLLGLAREQGARWIRVEPSNDQSLSVLQTSAKHKIQSSPVNVQSRTVLLLDITKTEDELLSHMKSKARYNINLAQKKNLNIFTTNDRKHVDAFYALVETTAKRKGVQFHNREHYRKMFEVIPQEHITLYVAEYDGKMIAANIVVTFGDVTTYLHGGTSDEHRNLMAPFLLQWQAIVDAKKNGSTHYDFGGVFPESADPGKQGITRFKEGFAPHTEPIVTAGTYDIVLSPVHYCAYRFLQKIKNIF